MGAKLSGYFGAQVIGR